MGVIAEKDFIKFLKNLLNISSQEENEVLENQITDNLSDNEDLCEYIECVIDDDYLEEYYDEIKDQIEDELENKTLDEMDGESISYKGLSKSTIAYLQDKSIKTKGDLLHYNPNILKNKNYISDIDAEIYKLKDLYNIERKKRIINKYLEEHPEDHPEEF